MQTILYRSFIWTRRCFSSLPSFLGRQNRTSTNRSAVIITIGNAYLTERVPCFPVRNGKLIKPQPSRGGVGKPRVSMKEIAELPAFTFTGGVLWILYSIQVRFPTLSAGPLTAVFLRFYIYPFRKKDFSLIVRTNGTLILRVIREKFLILGIRLSPVGTICGVFDRMEDLSGTTCCMNWSEADTQLLDIYNGPIF